MTLSAFFPLISFILVFILGFLVLRYAKEPRVKLTFFIFSVFTAIWMFGTFMMFLNKENVNSVLFWDRIVYVAVVFIPVAMLDFGLILINKKTKNTKFLILIGYIISFIFLSLIPNKDFVDGVYIYSWGAHSRAGIFHNLFLVYFSIYIALWPIFVVRHYIKLRPSIERERIKYALIAFAQYIILGPFGFLPAYGVDIFPFAYISGLLFTVMMAYAIVSYRLMDVKVILRQSSVYLTSLVLTLIPALFLKYLFDNFLPQYSYWIDSVIVVFSISIFPLFKERIYRFANKYFFSSLYDSRTVIRALSDRLGYTLETASIYRMIAESLGGALHMKAICFITCGPKDKDFIISYNNGFALPNIIRKNDLYNIIFKEYVAKNRIIILDELKNNATKQTKEIARALAKIGVEILVPLNVKDKPIGAIALSAKESGDTYNNEDLDLLKIIGTQTAISLENALLYEETKKFNIKLVKEVEKATHELQGANEELKKLDQAKSDFISIASHQLRTPLTVIKGYGSMMLEGSFGKMPSLIEENMQKIYDSNERLIALVEDLLNISRIESGRLQFNWEVGQLEEMVSSVVEELTPNAAKKGLSFKYQAPAKALPPIKLDKTKLRQVAINLIDNAIKYTDKGGLTVSLTQEAGKLKFCVADTGMGIKTENLPSLFKKFSRGEKTSILHTEGTGLGLYVGKMMVEAHGGRIWAESPGEKKGSKFCFEIPVASAVATAKTNAQNIK